MKSVKQISSKLARQTVERYHYLHRKPPVSYAFGLYDDGFLVGCCTFGIPASNHLLISVCPSAPHLVIELNRLWVHDNQPRNTESWFVARCLALLPTLIVVSYADTSAGHVGYIYRALNFHFSGWTDMERKTPRYDYVPHNGKHSRDAFRSGEFTRVRRKPKYKYWIVTGNKNEARKLKRLCRWPSYDWKLVRLS